MIRLRWQMQFSNGLYPVNRCGDRCIHEISLRRERASVNAESDTVALLLAPN